MESKGSDGINQQNNDNVMNVNSNASGSDSLNSNTVKRNRSAIHAAKRCRRVFGLDDDARQAEHAAGPIYPVISESFLLPNGCEEGNSYDEIDNPNGVVPVVVKEDLVNGFGKNLSPLTPEQKEGIIYLWSCVQVDRNGGILAHEMGLGKTRVAVVLVATLCEQSSYSLGKSTPYLRKCIIIVPKHAVTDWEDQFQMWCPPSIPCKVEVLRPMQRNGWEVVKEFKTNTSKVLILSYESFQKYNSKYEWGFWSYEENSVDLVICDEAQRLKNRSTSTVANLLKFKASKLWIGITGTPFQNNLQEICNLVEFFRKGIFGSTDFKKDYCQPITNELRKNGKLVGKTKTLLADLRKHILPALHIRKNAFDIEKHEITLCVPLLGHPNYGDTEEENELYALQHNFYKELATLFQCTEKDEIPFFEKLSYLHKTCIHPTELREAFKNPEREQLFQVLINKFDGILPPDDLNDPDFKNDMPIYSAKITVVTMMAQYLTKHHPEEKMVIVSNSTVLLKMLKQFFKYKLKSECLVYDGDTLELAREKVKKAFNTNPALQFLLLSLKAGGTALNLTRANHLVLMDPDYNPANDRQALGRIHRLGQERPVFIYRLLSTGTIEEMKYILQISKEDLAKCAMTQGGPLDAQRPFNGNNFLAYDENCRSAITKVLDEIDIEDFNLEESEQMDHNFADELKQSQQFSEAHKIPEKLSILQNIWKYISYAFYSPKIIANEAILLFDLPQTPTSDQEDTPV